MKQYNKDKYFIHEKSIVNSENIGEGTKIWAFCNILKGAKIGRNVNICDGCFLENQVLIGDNVTIKNGVYLWDGVNVGDNVFIGPNATFTNDIYPRSKNKDFLQKNTIIKNGSSIGANATILPGIVIGEYAMVGSGSVVTKDVPDYAIVYGNPASINGFACVCGNKMNFYNNLFECSCYRKYRIISGGVELISK